MPENVPKNRLKKLKINSNFLAENNDALIYVVDSCDRSRFTESREELDRILEEDAMRTTPVLILANKQDLPGAATCAEITNAFKMHQRAGREWYVQATVAPSGKGLVDGLQWMAKSIRNNRKK